MFRARVWNGARARTRVRVRLLKARLTGRVKVRWGLLIWSCRVKVRWGLLIWSCITVLTRHLQSLPPPTTAYTVVQSPVQDQLSIV